MNTTNKMTTDGWATGMNLKCPSGTDHFYLGTLRQMMNLEAEDADGTKEMKQFEVHYVVARHVKPANSQIQAPTGPQTEFTKASGIAVTWFVKAVAWPADHPWYTSVQGAHVTTPFGAHLRQFWIDFMTPGVTTVNDMMSVPFEDWGGKKTKRAGAMKENYPGRSPVSPPKEEIVEVRSEGSDIDGPIDGNAVQAQIESAVDSVSQPLAEPSRVTQHSLSDSPVGQSESHQLEIQYDMLGLPVLEDAPVSAGKAGIPMNWTPVRKKSRRFLPGARSLFVVTPMTGRF